MSQNANHCHFVIHVVLVSIILYGVQGHPHERPQQPTNQRAASPSNQTNTGDAETSHAAENRSIDSDGRIIFPTDSNSHTKKPPKFSPIPCENKTFCENPQSYPKDFIKTAINKREDLKYLSIVDTVPEISQRVDPDNDESLCSYEDIVVFPKSGENKAKQWLYIINEDNFPQGVRIESCMTENTACRIIEGLLPGYETSCKQKFVYRQLAAVTPEGSVSPDYFRFPASCCCHVKFTGNPASRFGIDLDMSQSPKSAVSHTNVKSATRKT